MISSAELHAPGMQPSAVQNHIWTIWPATDHDGEFLSQIKDVSNAQHNKCYRRGYRQRTPRQISLKLERGRHSLRAKK
jgi:hypothetical protein